MIRQVRRYLQPGEDGIPLGYSCSGTIEKVGEAVRNLREGFRVACYGAPYVYHAEMLSVPRNLAVELPKKVNHEEGAFTGIGAIAMHAFRRPKWASGKASWCLRGTDRQSGVPDCARRRGDADPCRCARKPPAKGQSGRRSAHNAQRRRGLGAPGGASDRRPRGGCGDFVQRGG
jgi:hypothetical protein